MSTLLAFNNVSLGYDQYLAVQNLKANIPEGSLTAIFGPNGAGKSTLLKGVIGALSPLEGSVALS